jgi:uncharacterized protein (TIGR00730 family)
VTAPCITVFMAANPGNSPRYGEVAAELGTAIARRGIRLVYGGGNVGLMGIVADACLAAGGHVTGVITSQLVAREVVHRGLDELHIVASMHERKAKMNALADGIIALPGGYGTLDETFEALTWVQLGLTQTPVVLLDVDGFWDPMLVAIDTIVDAGFVRAEHRALARRADAVDQAIEMALTPIGPLPAKWTVEPDQPKPSPRRRIPSHFVNSRAFPEQSVDVAWPTIEWPQGPPDSDVDAEGLDRLTGQATSRRSTGAVWSPRHMAPRRPATRR